MRKLTMPNHIFQEILEVVNACTVETGVRLFGQGTEVKYIVGPGPKAIKEFAEYECDNEYAEKEYTRLLEEEPALKFIGELHVHPRGFLRFSSTDLETIREVLKEYPE